MPYPLLSISQGEDIRNVYYDLSKYLNIFFDILPRMAPMRRITLFWSYMKSILMEPSLSRYENKMILCDISNFKGIKGPLKELLNNPVFLIYYTLFKNPSLVNDLNIDFIFYHGTYNLKVNLSTATKDTYRLFMKELKRLYAYAGVSITNELDDDVIEKQEREEIVSSQIVDAFNATGTTPINVAKDTKPVSSTSEQPKREKPIDKITKVKDDPAFIQEKEKRVNEKIAAKVKEADNMITTDSSPKTSEEQRTVINAVKTSVENSIADDKDLLKDIYEINRSKTVVKSQASTARDALLRKEQENIKVNNLTVKDLRNIDPSSIEIPVKDISGALKTTNDNVKQIRFANFNKQYLETTMNKDIVNAVTALNDKSLPIYIRKVDVKDSSDELNYKETWTFELEDENRQRMSLKVDIPKFIDNKFLYIGGNKKLILNQNFLLPVIKTSSNTVQIVTNYNKMTVSRNEVKTLNTIDRIQRVIKVNPEFAKCFSVGNAFESNLGYITTIEYDELSKFFTSYKYGDFYLILNQERAEEYAEEHNISITQSKLFIGTLKGMPIYIDTETQVTDDGKNIIDLIIENSSEKAKQDFHSVRSGKRLMYAEVTTMKKNVPVIIILSFWEGFSNILKKLDINYRLTDTHPRDLKPSEAVIKFKDCYLVYPNTSINSLLLSGLNPLKPDNYNLADLDSQEPFIEVFRKIYGKTSITNAIMNSYEFMIDPITLEVLKHINLPTNITDLLIYAVKLLSDNQYTLEINESLYRIRNAEIIPAILYDSIGKNYIMYKNSNGKKKLSIPRDDVIKKLLALKTVEDYSTLNPVLEMERTRALNAKGWRGINLDDSYTLPKRSYDPSMAGIVSYVTSPDASVGVAKTLTTNPNINTVRGYTNVIPVNEQEKNLKDVNVFSPGELTIPLGATIDDPIRVGHAIKQSKHVIPVKNSSPVLISNGMEEACRFDLSSDFVVNADADGTVVEKKNGLMIVEYKNSRHRAINLSPQIVKNGGGGFFESNVLVTNLEVGDKFKENEPLAWHKDFFRNNSLNGCRMTMGTLAKVAVTSSYATFQDATFVTDKLSHDAATEMCFCKQVVIGKNANVSRMVSVGDTVDVGDCLVQFDSSYDDSELNSFLATLAKDPRLESEILNSASNLVKSKIAGTIEDIKIYCTSELEELSPSLRKIVSEYYDKVNQKRRLLNKYSNPEENSSIMKCGMMFTDTSSKVSPSVYGVIKGQKVEDGSVLIEFYVKHTELLEVGSKIANFTALKNTICEVIPKGYEPYSEFRPNEEVSTIIASNSILKRMTPSILITGLGNKCIVELKRRLEDIWKKNNLVPLPNVRKEMTDIIYKFFTALDPSGVNTKRYKELFESMTDAQFKKFFDALFASDEYLILNIVDFEHTITIEDINKAAKVLDIPLFEKLYMPYVTMDKKNIVVSKQPVPILYIHIKRTQQTLVSNSQ